jgi:Na+-driven multidrug efflux pump
MRGAGETQVPMWISFFATVILRLPLAYILAYFTRTTGADSAWPNGQPSALFVSLLVSWVVAMLITVVTYRMKWWRRKLPDNLASGL